MDMQSFNCVTIRTTSVFTEVTLKILGIHVALDNSLVFRPEALTWQFFLEKMCAFEGSSRVGLTL